MGESGLVGIVIASGDNVATLLRDGPAGAAVRLRSPAGAELGAIRLRQDIPFGHKVALEAISADAAVRKYGEVIGEASRDIATGEHVHVHNVVSRRARGDLGLGQAGSAAPGSAPAPSGAPDPVPARATVSDLRFNGYPRPDGGAGTRNLVGVISCVACANDVVVRLADIPGVAVFTHQQGCSQTAPDIDTVLRVLLNLAASPNLGAVLFVSLGCESVPSGRLLELARALGKPVEMLTIQREGGLSRTEARARQILPRLLAASAATPEPLPLSRLRLGLKCGSSDTTQGLSANVIAGRITDLFVAHGAGVVIGETTEFMGAEHIAARRARDPATAAAILRAVAAMERRAMAMGVDMRGGQPTRGNIAGGLTTIEEKSLGALAKAGSAPFEAVIEYGARRPEPGLVMMDSPGREPEMLVGLAAAGCNLILFTTGRGAPQGFPFVPVLKVTGNAATAAAMSEHIDCSVAGVMSGEVSCEQAAADVFSQLLRVAGGQPTKAELCRYQNSMNIYCAGPVI